MKRIMILLSSICLMIVGIVISSSRDVKEIFAYNEIISQESKQYYEYVENEDGTLTTNELSRFDYEISVEVEKIKREEKTSYKELQKGDRYQGPDLPMLPDITLSGVAYSGSTTGSVTVTYQYATSAYYKIGTGSYTSFSSGTVFSAVGDYTIYCTNQYGPSAVYFSIVTGSASSNESYMVGDTAYETITTTVTTAKSWNYIQVATTCHWDHLVVNYMRERNVIYCTADDNQYDVNWSNLGTMYSYYKYEEDIYDSNFIYQYTDIVTGSGTSNLSSSNGHTYGLNNSGVCEISVNSPMPVDYDLQDDYSREVVRYVELEYVLTANFRIQDYNNTIATSEYITYYDDNPIICANGGNIFGWDNANSAFSGLGNLLATVTIAVTIVGVFISLAGLGIALTIVGFAYSMASESVEQNNYDYTVSTNHPMISNNGNYKRIETCTYFILC